MLQIGDLIDYHFYRGGELPTPKKTGYRYIVAGNGVFIQAKNRFVNVLQVVSGRHLGLNGLPSLVPYLTLSHKKFSGEWITDVANHAKQHLDKEVVYQIVMENGRFSLKVRGYGSAARVTFDDDIPASQVVADIHSHNKMGAFFSGTDNANEQDFRWYGVVGALNKEPYEFILRIGIYGHFCEVSASTLFGDVQGFTDKAVRAEALPLPKVDLRA